MLLKVGKNIDLRSHYGSEEQVIDEDTGKSVGVIVSRHGWGRRIYLFGDKYQGRFQSHAECVAFAKGVEAVLSHMISAPDEPASHIADY
jgi:hypothetical protein